MPPVPLTSSGPSAEAADESTIIRQLRRRIAETEKNLSIIYAGAAVAKSKGELALQFEKFAREELVKATNSLSCKYPTTFVFKLFESIDFMTRSLCAAVVNIDEAAESSRVHARIEALSDLARPHQVF